MRQFQCYSVETATRSPRAKIFRNTTFFSEWISISFRRRLSNCRINFENGCFAPLTIRGAQRRGTPIHNRKCRFTGHKNRTGTSEVGSVLKARKSQKSVFRLSEVCNFVPETWETLN